MDELATYHWHRCLGGVGPLLERKLDDHGLGLDKLQIWEDLLIRLSLSTLGYLLHPAEWHPSTSQRGPERRIPPLRWGNALA